jgi:hypothetical protein
MWTHTVIYRVDIRGPGCCSKTKQKGRREVLLQTTRQPTGPDAGAGDGDPCPSRPPAETTVSSPGGDGLSMRRLSDAPGRDRVMLYRHVATRPRFISTYFHDVGAEFAFHCRHKLAQQTRGAAVRCCYRVRHNDTRRSVNEAASSIMLRASSTGRCPYTAAVALVILIYSSADTADPVDRDVCTFPHIHPSSDFTTVGDIFADATNKDRRKKRLDNYRVAVYVWPVLPAGSAPAECRRDTLRGCAQWLGPRSSRRLRLVGGVTSRTSASAMRRSSDGFSLATTWKRYVRAAAGKRVPRGLSGEARTPRVGHSIIGIPVVAEKHCCAM